MKRTRVVLLVWAVVYIAAIAANLNSFWWGDSAALGQLGVTVLYTVMCVLCQALTQHSHRWLQFDFFCGLAAVVGGVSCLLARNGVSWAVIPGLVLGGPLFAPLYGLSFLEPLGDWDEFYRVMLALSVLWTSVSGFRLLRGRRNDEKAG